MDVLGVRGETGGGLEDLLRAELLDLLLGVLQLAEHGGDLLRQLLGTALDQLLELGDDRVLLGEEVVRVHAHQGLDAAHAGADGGLAEQLHQTQLGGVADVRAAAQLLGEVADGHDAHALAVLLAELGDGALLLRLVDAHDLGGDVELARQHVVDLLLDVGQDRAGNGVRRTEVEAEAARAVLGAGLGGRRAEGVAQRLVGQVRGRVGAGDGPAAADVDGGVRGGAHRHLADLDGALVHGDARNRLLHVADDDDGAGVELDPALVGELAAALGVEGGAVEDDLDLVALGGGGRGDAVDQEAHDGGLALVGGVAGELGAAGAVGDLPVGGHVRVAGLLGLGVGLGPVALLLHQSAEAGLVHGQALLGGHLEGEVDREAPGVVEQERLVAGEDRATGGLGLGHGGVEDVGAALDGLQEGGLFGEGDGLDALAVGDELRVLLAHRVDHDVDQVPDDGTRGAHEAHVADGAAHDAAQHVAAALVAGGDAVADEHGRGADVVGDHAQRDVRALGGAVLHAGQLGGLVHDHAQGVGLVHVLHALQDHREAFEAETRVDVLRRQVAEDREVVLPVAGAALVLHEDQVPDLHVTLVVDGRAALDAELGAAVVVDLRAGAAGAGDSHGPEVVLLAQALDALGGDADLLAPDLLGLVVVEVDGDPELLRLQAVAAVRHGAGQQLPGVLDGAFLEVIAEGEVAAHLEEGAVAGGLADLFDVRRTDALLDAGERRGRRLGLAQEVGLERHHARGHQQQSRVVRDERRRRDNGVTALLEEAQPAAANLSRLHQWSSFRSYENLGR